LYVVCEKKKRIPTFLFKLLITNALYENLHFNASIPKEKADYFQKFFENNQLINF